MDYPLRKNLNVSIQRLWYILLYVHYFLSYGKETKNSCKVDATVNFFSTVAGNITVKAKRKSNLENYNLILCFATSAFSLTLRFKDATAARMSKKNNRFD